MIRTQSLLGAILCAMVLGMAGCGGEKKADESADSERHGGGRFLTLSARSLRDIGLSLSVAEVSTLSGRMTVPAKLIPNQDLEAQVGSLVPGRVREVFVKVGDQVREGEELMHIEGLEVGEIKSNFIKAKAELKYAEASYERQKTLQEQNIGSRKSLLEAEAAYDKALAEFNAEDKRIHSIGLSDDDLLKFVEHGARGKNDHSGGVLPIKAPIAGTVVERNVVTGQLVDAATTAFRIVNTAALWADGQVYEHDASRVAGKPEVTLTVTAYPGEEFRGKVIYVSPVVDERTRTIAIRASVPNRDGRLKPQMFGELHVPIGGTRMGLRIPEEAVHTEGAVRYVFVATSDTTFERRDVVIGAAVDSLLEVRSGIRQGERIVTRGSFQLKSELLKETLGEEH